MAIYLFSVKTFVFSSFVVPPLIKREGCPLHSGQFKVKVKVTLRQTVSQSVSLGVEPHLGIMTRYFHYCLAVTVLFLWGAHSDERTGVFCICCWPFPAQPFSCPSPLELATIFYCFTFETSLFVASYDSQGHGGGIRPRLHTGSIIHV
jgi:hypothetical protein